MGERGPRQAILEHLVGRRGRPAVQRTVRGTGGLAQPVVLVGGAPFVADPDSVRFLKERGIPGRRLFAVAFDDERGERWFWLVGAEQDETGAWLARGGAGGSGLSPERVEPWVNLAGWWGLEGFYAGGEVKPAGADVARVRLRCANEVELEDDADGGVVLFLTDRAAQTPVTVEICDSNGNILGSYSDF